MNWLNQVPIPIPGAPNMTWAGWIWIGCFLVAGLSFIRLCRHAFKAYHATDGADRPEKILAVGLVFQQLDSLAIVAAGLTVGVLSVTGPRVPAAPLNGRPLAGLLFLLALPALKAVQGLVAVRIHDAALKELKLKR